MGKGKALQAIPVPQAQVAAGAQTVVERAKEALSRPIYSRTVHEVYDPERDEWVPDERVTEKNATPGGVLAVVAGLVVAGAGLQRAARTGTIAYYDKWRVEAVSASGKVVWKKSEAYEVKRPENDADNLPAPGTGTAPTAMLVQEGFDHKPEGGSVRQIFVGRTVRPQLANRVQAYGPLAKL